MSELAVPRWGAEGRDRKGRGIVATVAPFLDRPLADSVWCDLGCGSGGIAATIAPHVRAITGIDPEPWPDWDTLKRERPNLAFIGRSVEGSAVPAASVDVVICNQVYEHAADPRALIAEIHRLLRPGGLCYFAGPNLLFPVEPHTLWPFLHWLPRPVGLRILRAFGSRAPFDAYSVSYWTLRRWLGAFEIRNAVPYMLRHPRQFGRVSWPWRLLATVPAPVWDALTWLSPGFVFVLRKP